jgi:hypothetical protein
VIASLALVVHVPDGALPMPDLASSVT